MSRSFFEDEGPQPPKVLRSSLEITAQLKLVEQGHRPLTLHFEGRAQRYQSYVVAIDKERNLIALDELIPSEGERLLLQGEPFHVETYYDGVRISWKSDQQITASELNGARCYWSWLPTEISYHQRRSTYRATLKQSPAITASLANNKLKTPLKAELLDLSATGCKLRIIGNASQQISNGDLFDDLRLKMPFGVIACTAEIRHVAYEEKVDMTFLGIKFKQLSGLDQRQVERFVQQLQREAKQEEE